MQRGLCTLFDSILSGYIFAYIVSASVHVNKGHADIDTFYIWIQNITLLYSFSSACTISTLVVQMFRTVTNVGICANRAAVEKLQSGQKWWVKSWKEWIKFAICGTNKGISYLISLPFCITDMARDCPSQTRRMLQTLFPFQEKISGKCQDFSAWLKAADWHWHPKGFLKRKHFFSVFH